MFCFFCCEQVNFIRFDCVVSVSLQFQRFFLNLIGLTMFGQRLNVQQTQIAKSKMFAIYALGESIFVVNFFFYKFFDVLHAFIHSIECFDVEDNKYSALGGPFSLR